MAAIQAHYSDDKSTIALYVDGVLKTIGPQPEVLNSAIQMLGIKQIFDDDFMLGQGTYTGAAKTLDEIRAFKAQSNAAEATRLREEAQVLMRRADELEGKNL